MYNGPNIVTDGLVLDLDAANIKSYASQNLEVDVLVVGGGGGGGLTYGPGGGAGGLVFFPSFNVQKRNVQVDVGSGGSGKTWGIDGAPNNGENGENSSFDNITALGGGGGNSSRYGGGSDGGSGGGADSSGIQPQQPFPSGNPYGYGNDGSNTNDGGGGGGAGEPGDGHVGGDGLNEISINGITYNFASIFGTQYGEIINGEAWFAGGGSGGNYTTTESKGGGGARLIINSNERRGAPGNPNTGGGGGGMNTSSSVDKNTQNSGDGGSGIVLIRYKGPQKATGGTITHFNGYTIHAFTSSGTFSVGDFIGDISGNNNSGELINGPTFDGGNNGSIVFDGINDTISTELLFDKDDFTYSAWFKWNGSNSQSSQDIIDSIDNNSQEWARIMIRDSTGEFWFVIDNDGFKINGQTGVYIDTNKWYYGVGVWTRSTGLMETYINGDKVFETIHPNKSTIFAVNSEHIGSNSRSNNEFFNGEIPNIQIYNKALTSEEVLQNYNATKSRFGL